MVDDKKQTLNEFAGIFVELALTNAQVAQAIAAEARLGIRVGDCAFLSGSGEVVTDAGVISKSV
jgi:hypothetical protein